MIIYYVMNKTGSGVAFLSKDDALYASTGIAKNLYVNELALKFRRFSDAKKGQEFPIMEVEVPDSEKTNELCKKLQNAEN